MMRRWRQRDRAWIGLGLVLGLILGGVPAADGCPMRPADVASGKLVRTSSAPDPTGHPCCRADDLATALPARAGSPAPTSAGAPGSCLSTTRTIPCCCAAGGSSQAVAERSARPGVTRGEARSSADSDLGSTFTRPTSASPSLLIATGPPRPGPSRVPLYLRTARLRN